MQSVSIQLTGDKLPELTPLFGFRCDTNPGGCRSGNLLLNLLEFESRNAP